MRNVGEKLFARAVEPNQRRLIVGEDDDALRVVALVGQADRPRRDRCAGRRVPVSMSGATEASPRSASAMRRSSSTLGIGFDDVQSDRARRDRNRTSAPAAGVGELDVTRFVDEDDADRQRRHQTRDGAVEWTDRRGCAPAPALRLAARGPRTKRAASSPATTPATNARIPAPRGVKL